MKKLQKLAGTLALALCATSASAIIINISNFDGALTNGVAFGEITGGGDPTTIHSYLTSSIIPGYNSIVSPATPLASPDAGSLVDYGSVAQGAAGPISLTGFDFASVHYGGGPGGGMHVFYYLNGMTGDHTFDANGSGVGDGTGTGETFGNGKYVGSKGISNVRLWSASGSSSNSTPVHDSGNTLILLGVGLGILCFYKHRKPV